LAIVQKGYHNSFLIIENFDQFKLDMKLAKEEMQKELLKDIEKLRLEVRQTLQNQMSFIEETYIDTKGMQKANNDLILDYNLKFENILSSVQSKVVNQELNREQQSLLMQNTKVLTE